MWKTLFRTFSSSISELCFPSLCISCESKIEQGMLCSFCSEKIDLINTKNRCPICFEEQENRCFRCSKKKVLPRAYTCEDFGPAQILARHLSHSTAVQKNIGSLMVVQLCALRWPMPDVLIPLPMKEEEGLNLARQISSFVPAEVRAVIHRKGFLSTAGLKREEGFRVEKEVNLSDKNCLVVSLNRLKEEAMEELGKRIYEAAPKGVFFLSFVS